MKKITLLTALLFTLFINAQFSTNEVTLNANLLVTIETQPDEVKLTLTGPSNQWFAVGFGGTGMGSVSDVFLYDGSGNFDRVGLAYAAPTTDTNQDWEIISNTVSGTDRTILAKRSLSTSESDDYTFVNSSDAIPIIWAFGNSMTLEQHEASNRGIVSLPRTAVASVSTQKNIQFALYPNPVQTELNIVLPSNLDNATLEIYDILGKKVAQRQLKTIYNKIDISNLNSGVYTTKISGQNDHFGVKQFIKK